MFTVVGDEVTDGYTFLEFTFLQFWGQKSENSQSSASTFFQGLFFLLYLNIINKYSRPEVYFANGFSHIYLATDVS